MKVLFINPATAQRISTNLPTLVEQERGVLPSLGLMYVAAATEKYTEHQVEFLDMQVEDMTYAWLEEELKKRKPDVVATQAITFTLLDALQVCRTVKKVNPDILVVLGGPHVFIYPEETIRQDCVDFLVLGEAELYFPKLLEALRDEKKLQQVQGIVFKKKNGEVVQTPHHGFIQNLDEIPFPARHLTPYKKYYSLIAKRAPVTTMITSRGCPYRCTFCMRPHLGKLFRAHSPQYVVEELKACLQMGIKEFMIYDDTFTIDKKRVEGICDLILKEGLEKEIGWDVRARVNTVDEALLKKMRQAGCERIHFGIESGDPAILKVLQKDITVDQTRNAFRWAKEAGISTLGYFMIGNPTETAEQIQRSIDFALELEPDYVHFSVTTPFPATPLYEYGLKKGVFKMDFWKEFAQNPQPGFMPQLWEEVLTRDQLLHYLRKAYKSFYVRPKYILARLKDTGSLLQLWRRFKAGLKLIRA